MATTQKNNSTTLEATLFTERDPLVRLCAQLTGDATLAEDLAQETLLIAWQNGHQLRDPARAIPTRWPWAVVRMAVAAHEQRRHSPSSPPAPSNPIIVGARCRP